MPCERAHGYKNTKLHQVLPAAEVSGLSKPASSDPEEYPGEVTAARPRQKEVTVRVIIEWAIRHQRRGIKDGLGWAGRRRRRWCRRPGWRSGSGLERRPHRFPYAAITARERPQRIADPHPYASQPQLYTQTRLGPARFRVVIPAVHVRRPQS